MRAEEAPLLRQDLGTGQTKSIAPHLPNNTPHT